MSTQFKARFTSGMGAVLLLVAATTGLPSHSADAGPRQKAHRKDAAVDNLLPYTNVVDPQVLKRDYTNMRVTPYSDPKFYFEVTVPREFQNQPVQVTRQQLSEDSSTPVPMAEFTPNGNKGVLIEARYVRVPEKVTLDRFMSVYAEQAGFEIVKRQRGDFDGRQVEDALLSVNSPVYGRTLTRLTVSRRGDFIFMVAGSCREEEYAKWKQAFAVAALSFSPTGK